VALPERPVWERPVAAPVELARPRQALLAQEREAWLQAAYLLWLARAEPVRVLEPTGQEPPVSLAHKQWLQESMQAPLLPGQPALQQEARESQAWRLALAAQPQE
jgi:hypothetical protein